MKILTILGARPQFIKAGSVSRAIALHNSKVVSEEEIKIKNQKLITEIIVHTGQHYDANMSDIFFEEMQIPKPNYFLGIGGKSHGAMTGQMIEKIEEVALKEKPDWIMVYGDTNSTLAGAIVASKLHIKLAHVEAGLRSFNMKMPEEVNRILTDRVSNILFCPTDTAMQNLKNEGYENLDCKIVKSGDVMQDGAIFYKNLAIKPNIEIKKDFILCTIHRAENTDDEIRLKSIFEALDEIAKEKQVILPLHPRTKKILENLKLDISNLTIIEPVGYLEMVWLISNCNFVMTDSGGLQKEAYFFEKQCITLRDETEWVELVECGSNTLVGANKEKIIETYINNSEFNKQNSKLDLYGGGKASQNIINELLEF
ncbi:non-hydrolyzing UDP-N-acetylglucosamine 2-epimerase [Aliarcobacter butzleri]|uniref:non-hydrolyzing UDP-N-acetylglucosamine 2-epimerase n=1 Tax=Aliarcobacter butzleri TaxID=28197 RepID=UPI003BB05788